MSIFGPFPDARLESNKRVKVRVDSGSGIYLDRNAYSVHSRWIGSKSKCGGARKPFIALDREFVDRVHQGNRLRPRTRQ